MKYDLLVTMADLIGLILSSLLISAMKRAVVTCRPDMGVVLLLKGVWCSVYKAAKLDEGNTNQVFFFNSIAGVCSCCEMNAEVVGDSEQLQNACSILGTKPC